jgi:hypothetical protein
MGVSGEEDIPAGVEKIAALRADVDHRVVRAPVGGGNVAVLGDTFPVLLELLEEWIHLLSV